MKYDLNQMIIYAKVVDLGSFIAASQALGIPKTTVSRKIAELEERVGAKLLHRNARKISLTAEGAVYYERCAQIAADVAEADSSVSGIQKAPSGTLRISIPDQLGPTIIRDLLHPFVKEYPDIGIEAVRPPALNQLAENGIDVAFHFGHLPDSDLHAINLGSANYYLYASQNYLKLFGEPKHPDELSSHICIELLENKQSSAWVFKKGNESYSHELQTRYSVESELLCRQLAISGIGISQLSNVITYLDVKSKRLFPILRDWHLHELPIYVIYPSRKYLPVRTRAILDYIKSVQEILGRQNPLLNINDGL